MSKFTVKKCTESENGGFVLTVTNSVGTRKVFGVDMPIENRYCMKSPVEVPIGAEQELNEADYIVTQYDGGGLPYIRVVALGE
jgi:hypothetical protein